MKHTITLTIPYNIRKYFTNKNIEVTLNISIEQLGKISYNACSRRLSRENYIWGLVREKLQKKENDRVLLGKAIKPVDFKETFNEIIC